MKHQPCLLVLLGSAAMCAAQAMPLVADLEQVALREDFSRVDAWHAEPSWLSNPSPTATVATDGNIACFAVPEPNRGMKWSRQTPDASLEEMHYLVVRYRAENVQVAGNDYFVYLDDGGDQQCNALRPGDIVADGQWHIVAVDAAHIAAKPEIKAIAIQVQAAAAGNARLWLDWLMFSDRVPKDATELRATPQPLAAPDWTALLASAKWTAQPSWLSNPCAASEVVRDGDATVYRANESNRGMKWLWTLPERASLANHRYLALRYRATNCRPVGDYALCVMGKPKSGDRGYLPVIANREIISDGRWHVLSASLGEAAAQFNDIGGIAVQVQGGAKSPAEFRMDRLVLTNHREPRAVSEFLTISTAASFAGFHAADISALCNNDAARFAKRMSLTGLPDTETLTVEGIPFKLPPRTPDVCCSTFEGREELAVPLKTKASEVCLLLWAAFAGAEEPSRGTGRLQKIADVDRFRVRLEYADGLQTECLPLNVATRQFEIREGPQVLCAFAEPSKELRRIVMRDLTSQGVFGIAAITCRVAKTRLFGEFAEDTPPLRAKEAKPVRSSTIHRASARLAEKCVELSNTHLAMTLEFGPLPRVVQWVNRATRRDCLANRETEPLLRLAAGELKLAGLPDVKESDGRAVVQLRYDVAGALGVQAVVRAELGDQPEVAFDVAFENRGPQAAQFGFTGPTIGAFCLGGELRDNYYLLPKRGAAFHNTPCNYRERYCGHDMPLQFVSIVNPSAGEGLYLRTEDTNDTWRHYCLRKDEKGMSFGVECPSESLAPGATRRGSRTIIGVSGGDWREGFEAYRRWLRTWYQPAAPRQQWYREVFNFRQRFLWGHDPLYDRKTGELHLERAIAEAQEKFGGMEYLHLFDWGYCGKFGRIYGRTGDYSPYDYINGGRDALRRAIAGVQARGVRAGLYIEGYLLEERGKLGQAHGRGWQLVHGNGERVYWPKSTEMFMCPWVPAWREVQASTYAARVSELDVNGMYVDQFGFADRGKDCFSKEHGHPVPGYAVQGERDCMRQIRERVDAVKRGVVLYGEECVCDVNSQFQDGSFTYAMSAAAHTETLAPLNLLRFAIPSFKTFEILICDKPTGTWATGVKWVFFNGEGIWLEGPADEWFAPETLATIRKCHTILREHKDAFTSNDPVPLVPTEAGGVFANLFPTLGKQVFTLYNSRHRTFIGDVLRVPHVAGSRYRDAWNGCELRPRREGKDDVLAINIEPQGVGCMVVTQVKR